VGNEEISLVKRFLNEFDFIEASPVELRPEQRVKIMNGVLMDEEGVVVRSDRNKVEVVLYSLGFRLTAQLTGNEIRPVS
jgi:transcription antitermination factor NusG